MKRYAVAFNYDKIPKYNRTEIEDNMVQCYMDDVPVFSYGHIPGSITTVERGLGLDIVEAEDERSAMIIVREHFPYMIREMTALET